MSSAAVWVWAAPSFGVDTMTTLAASSVLAAGAGVLPDLDHPDAYPSRQFGILSRVVSRLTRGLSGGHRQGTHSLMFAAVVGGALWAAARFVSPDTISLVSGGLAIFIATVGISLTAPSVGVRASPLAALALGSLLGWWVWSLSPAPWLPPLLSIGIAVHIAGDWLTKSGVPLLAPFVSRRWSAGLLRTGGRAEVALGLVFWVIAATGVWRFVASN